MKNYRRFAQMIGHHRYTFRILHGRLFQRQAVTIETPVQLDTNAKTITVSDSLDATLLIPLFVRAVATAWADEMEAAGYRRHEVGYSIVLRPVCPQSRTGISPVERFSMTVLDPRAVGLLAAIRDAARHVSHDIRAFFWPPVARYYWREREAMVFGEISEAWRLPAYARSDAMALFGRDDAGRWRCPHCRKTYRYAGPFARHINDHGDTNVAHALFTGKPAAKRPVIA